MVNDELREYREERKSVEKQRTFRIFIAHLGIFIIGNLFLGGWNAVTYYVKGSEVLWFVLPLTFWGVGVLIHYLLSVALFDEWWERDEKVIRDRS